MAKTDAPLRTILRVAGFVGVCFGAGCGSGPGVNGRDAGQGGDGMPAPPADCVRTVGGLPQGQQVLRFQSAQPPVRVHLQRRYVSFGVGESVIYEVQGMWVEWTDAGQPVCTAIVDAARLQYTNSHHNWRDVASGTAAGTRFTLTMNFGAGVGTQGWSITLSASDSASARVLLGPVDLLTTGGPISLNSFPSNLPIYVSEGGIETTTAWTDDAGDRDPWIELFNPSSGAVNLEGWFLSNDPAQPRLWAFPAGVTISRHEHLVIAADGQPEQGPRHAGFRLSGGGGYLMLSAPSGLSAGERAFPPLPAGQSARYSPTTDSFGASRTPTPGGGEI